MNCSCGGSTLLFRTCVIGVTAAGRLLVSIARQLSTCHGVGNELPEHNRQRGLLRRRHRQWARAVVQRAALAQPRTPQPMRTLRHATRRHAAALYVVHCGFYYPGHCRRLGVRRAVRTYGVGVAMNQTSSDSMRERSIEARISRLRIRLKEVHIDPALRSVMLGILDLLESEL